MNAVFPYLQVSNISWLPIVPLKLESAEQSVTVEALIDSGASVNVLPYRMGLGLGLTWDDHVSGPSVTGNFSSAQTKMVALNCTLGSLESVQLGFVWTNQDLPRILLGQQNFFLKYDVCFVGRMLKVSVIEIEEGQ